LKEDRIISLFAEAEPTTWDDCARIGNFLITTDSMVEGNHFRLDWSSPEDLANKLIQVNFSDIASSGGQPKYCLLNLGLSEISSSQEWIRPVFSRISEITSKIWSSTYRRGYLLFLLHFFKFNRLGRVS
jgi:thiamine-monophosphate kinase